MHPLTAFILVGFRLLPQMVAALLTYKKHMSPFVVPTGPYSFSCAVTVYRRYWRHALPFQKYATPRLEQKTSASGRARLLIR